MWRSWSLRRSQEWRAVSCSEFLHDKATELEGKDLEARRDGLATGHPHAAKLVVS